MKLIFSVCMMLMMLAPLQAHAQLNIVATTPALAQIAQAVCGPEGQVKNLARVGQDPHFVPPKPTLARHLAQADILFSVGLALESGWLPPLISLSRNNNIREGGSGYFAGADYVQVTGANAKADRSMGDVHPEGNPHWWIDPIQVGVVAEALADRMSVLDPEHAKAYAERANKFGAQLKALVNQWKPTFAQLKPVVTYHDSYRYFVDRFGIKVVGFVEPKPGVEPSTRHLDALITQMKAEGVQQIWNEPYHQGRLSKRIASLSGAKLLEMPDAVEGEGAKGYLSMMTKLLNAASGNQP